MKTLFTILLLAISLICFGQPLPKKADQHKIDSIKAKVAENAANHFSIQFDELNGAKVIEANNANIYARKADSVKWVMVREYLTYKHVDFSRISDKGDSLKLTPKGLDLILRPDRNGVRYSQ